MDTATDTAEQNGTAEQPEEAPERTTPETFRAELRTVLQGMRAPERLNFLRGFDHVARAAELKGRRWYFDLDALTLATEGLARVDEHHRFIDGALKLTPLYRSGSRAQLDLIIATLRGD